MNTEMKLYANFAMLKIMLNYDKTALTQFYQLLWNIIMKVWKVDYICNGEKNINIS